MREPISPLDYFAGLAMQRIIAHRSFELTNKSDLAEIAYNYAAAMMTERERRIDAVAVNRVKI